MSRYYKYGGYKLSESCNRDCSKQKACDNSYHLSSSGSGNCVYHDTNPNLYNTEKYKLLNDKFTAPVFPALDLPLPPLPPLTTTSEFPTSMELEANPVFNDYMNDRLSNPEPEFGGGARYRKKSKSRRKSRSMKRKSSKRRRSSKKSRSKRRH
jgi:hypothetical protein